MAVPTNDPRSVIVGLFDDNMATVDGDDISVNSGWLEPKRQKKAQLALSPSYSEVETAHMDVTTGVQRVVETFFILHLFAPTRALLWELYTAVANVLNTRSLVNDGVNSDTDYRFVQIARSDVTKAMETMDKECEMPNTSGGCIGYRRDITLVLVHHE